MILLHPSLPASPEQVPAGGRGTVRLLLGARDGGGSPSQAQALPAALLPGLCVCRGRSSVPGRMFWLLDISNWSWIISARRMCAASARDRGTVAGRLVGKGQGVSPDGPRASGAASQAMSLRPRSGQGHI